MAHLVQFNILIYNIFLLFFIKSKFLAQILYCTYLIVKTNFKSMKSLIQIILVAVMLLSTYTQSNAQVGIGTTAPDASAVLELNSSSKGFLPPRMTAYPTSPAIGLTVYRTDLNGYYTWNGTAWTQNVFGSSSSSLSTITVSALTYTIALTDAVIILNTVSGQTLTLPSASAAVGKVYWIINTATSAKSVNSYINLSNNNTNKLSGQSSITLLSDGTSWKQIQGSETDNSGGAQSVGHATKFMSSDVYHTPWQSPWGLLNLSELNIDVPAGKTLHAEYMLYGQTSNAAVPPSWLRFTGPTFATDYFWAQLSFKNSTSYDTGEDFILFNQYQNENDGTVIASQVDTEFPTANAVYPMLLKLNYKNKGTSPVTLSISFAGDRSGTAVTSLGILATSNVVYSIY